MPVSENNEWKNKRCNACSRIGFSIVYHPYTMWLGRYGKLAEAPNCEFFMCNFCSAQTPTALTLQKLGELQEAFVDEARRCDFDKDGFCTYCRRHRTDFRKSDVCRFQPK